MSIETDYFQLTTQHIFWRIERLFGKQQIVSRASDGSLDRYSYLEFSQRVRKLAHLLNEKLGLKKGDMVGSLAWNTRRHLELYLATTMMGYVLHTINVRFHQEEIEFVLNEAQDKVLFFDSDLTGTLINLTKRKNNMEPVLHEMSGSFDALVNFSEIESTLPPLKETDPAILCYTSGTTGHPKGVAYTHRTVFLHSSMLLQRDTLGISSTETVLPIVPMFHISAWDTPFASLMAGAKLVLPGPRPRSVELVELVEKEKVTLAIGAPTIWIDFLQVAHQKNHDISSLKTVVTGGTEPPRSLVENFSKNFGIRTYHAWGMTETEAISSVNTTVDFNNISRQGVPPLGLEVEMLDDDDKPLPWDGESMGELVVTGAWVARSYFRHKPEDTYKFIERDGRAWLRTGDIVTIDPSGSIKIVDRKKDLIKSGGEWISSVDLENAIMLHEAVLEAAVVGVPDDRWDERPVAFVSMKDPSRKTPANEIINFLKTQNRFPNWWLPDKIYFVEGIQKTSTGKFDKKSLRKTATHSNVQAKLHST